MSAPAPRGPNDAGGFALTAVLLPVADPDRSLAFYRDVLGFLVAGHDSTQSEWSRMELRAPGGGPAVVITAEPSAVPAGRSAPDQPAGPDGGSDLFPADAPEAGSTGATADGAMTDTEAEERYPSHSGPVTVLSVADLDGAIADLSARGLSFTAEPQASTLGWFTTFEDPDGHSWMLQEPTRRLGRHAGDTPGTRHPGGLVVLRGASRNGESTVVADGVSVLYAASDAPGLLDVYVDSGETQRLRGNAEPATVFTYSHQVTAEGIAPEMIHMPSSS